MIITKGLTKEYKQKIVVKDLNLQVKVGEIYGFLGPNGAGKSTTINMILGLIPITRGVVSLFGRSSRENPTEIRRRMGVLGEYPYVYGEMTGYEYLSFFADLYRIPRKKQRITELLERMELFDSRNFKLNTYSKGMKQKISFIRAVLHEPELLILDEPLLSLDPNGIKQIRDYIIELNKSGMTIFISSHLLTEVEKICTKIGIIQNGILVVEDTVEGLKKRFTLNGKNPAGLEEMFILLTKESFPGIA